MTTFLYRCPKSGQTAPVWSVEEAADDDTRKAVNVLGLSQVRLAKLKIGKVLGEEDA